MMYRDNGIDKDYEDAIPVKRSKRSQRVRDASRRENVGNKSGADISMNRANIPAHMKRPTDRRAPQIPDNNAGSVHKKTRALSEISQVNGRIPTRTDNVRPVTDVTPAVISRTTTDVHPRHAGHSHVAGEMPRMRVVPHGREVTDNRGPRTNVSFSRVARSSESEPTPKKLTAGTIVRRSLLSVFTALALVVVAVFGACFTVAHGPSETVRNTLVLSALQASATKWVPGLFLDSEVVDQILADSQKVSKDVISVEDYVSGQGSIDGDMWTNAIDGMIYEEISGPTFKGYVLLIKDPKRVTVGVATDNFTEDTEGLTIFDMTKKYGSVAAINGGEYPDNGGFGIGGRPIGLTYSDGECVWSDGLVRTFMGFDANDRLVVREGMTKAEAEELGIRDGVCFQTGNTLITNENGEITIHYAGNNTGTAQRTAIGQTVDGTVILLVTDGRTASSLGATHNDVIDVMISYGAVSAGMLDGGSSTLMYYENYYDKYDIDKSLLDEYQKQGLVNKYKAFTTPRRLPTCFIVAAE